MRNYNVSQEHMYNVDNAIRNNQIGRLHIRKQGLHMYCIMCIDNMKSIVQERFQNILDLIDITENDKGNEYDKILIQLLIDLNMYEFITFK